MTEDRPRCLRCEDTLTYKKCSRCGDTFTMALDYQSYRLPTQLLDKYESHWHRFKYYDLCNECAEVLAPILREFLNE